MRSAAHRYRGGVSTRNACNGAIHLGIEYSGAMSCRTTLTIASPTCSAVKETMPGRFVCGNPSVGTKPGLTAVTRTPFGFVVADMDSLNATTACFVAE